MDISSISSFVAQEASHKGAAKTVQTAKEFEAFFMFQVLELMAPEPNEDSLLGGSFAEQIFRHQLNEEAAKEIVERGGIGLSDQLYDQLLTYQEQEDIQ